MIVLMHPRAASARSRRFPLSILALAAVLEGKEEYTIIDGNVNPNAIDALAKIHAQTPVDLLAVSVMPGPQMVAAIPICRSFRAKYPLVPIIWGGYFPSLYPDAALNAEYVDYVVRSQGEDTLVELVAALKSGGDLSTIRGLSYKDGSGRHFHNPSRPLRSPNDFPWFPYDKLDISKYILPTFLGSRTAVHNSSVGCPFKCNFCGVAAVFDDELQENPERTASVMKFLKNKYAVNAIQFYDNNFFLQEGHARELAERLTPLELRWWCQARITTLNRYSNSTLRALRQAGMIMVYCGAESGSDWALKAMDKKLGSEQTLEFAEKIRSFGIIPEFSFVTGNPKDPERDVLETIHLIRKLKHRNPDTEIIIQHYIPTPQPGSMYGGVEKQMEFPATPEEWAEKRWYDFTMRRDPQLAWLRAPVKRRIENFRLIVNSRWPTIQDRTRPRWARLVLKLLSSWRYALGIYSLPIELRLVDRLLRTRDSIVENM